MKIPADTSTDLQIEVVNKTAREVLIGRVVETTATLRGAEKKDDGTIECPVQRLEKQINHLLTCAFDEKHVDKVAKVGAGQQVKVRGTIKDVSVKMLGRGPWLGLTLTECELK